jgi:hypothetical protein
MKMAALIVLALGFQSGAPCKWGPARQMGSLEAGINEASGVAISRRFANRIYHINDSGDEPGFFVTDWNGRDTRRVDLTGPDVEDTEDLDLAPCGTGDCLFIADIGDNDEERSHIEIVIVEEVADFSRRVAPRSRIRIRYPDGPHDAEALAVHPNGDIYILTKTVNISRLRLSLNDARVYRLKRDNWFRGGNSVSTLELAGTIDFSRLLPGSILGGRVPTGMDISPDGKRVLILTYQNAVELFVDLSLPMPRDWSPGRNLQAIPLINLEQQEAIAYLPDGRGFVYTTERRNARIMIVRCPQ